VEEEEEVAIVDKLAAALKEDTRLHQVWQRLYQTPHDRQTTEVVWAIAAASTAWQTQRRIVQQLESEAGIRRLAHLQVK
jgi:hypothetical protein